MAYQTQAIAATGPTAWLARRVYSELEADMYAEDGTPLYLEWIIEGKRGELYRVPAEPGGWLRRTPYEECPDGLKPVPVRKAEIIVWLTYADTDDAASVNTMAHTRQAEHRAHERYAGYTGYEWHDGEF